MASTELPLTTQQISEIRSGLERMLQRLERSISVNGKADTPRDLDQSSIGRLSRIEALQNQGLTQTLKEREQTQCDEVRQAIGRLDAGTYGICSSCRAPIAHARLFVYPETRTCGECPSGH